MQKVFAQWPTAIWQNPFEIGKQTMYPGALIEQNLGFYEPNPVVEAYKLYQQMPYDRPSWDILSVLYTIHPDLFTHSVAGTVTVDDEGYTWFTPDEGGKHIVLSATLDQPQAIMKVEQAMTLRYGEWESGLSRRNLYASTLTPRLPITVVRWSLPIGHCLTH